MLVTSHGFIENAAVLLHSISPCFSPSNKEFFRTHLSEARMDLLMDRDTSREQKLFFSARLNNTGGGGRQGGTINISRRVMREREMTFFSHIQVTLFGKHKQQA